jgi:hypothetical protein
MGFQMSDAFNPPPQPPPLPPHFATSAPIAKPRREGFFVQAARASWRAPFIAVVLGFCTFGMREKDRTVAIIIGSANGLIICLGLLLAIIGLYGAFVRRVKGIVTPAIIGLLVNSLLILASYSVLSRARQTAELLRQQARQKALDDAEQHGRDAAEKYPGWLGFGRLPTNALIGVTQMNDDAPFANDLKASFGTRCSQLIFAVDNTQGTTPLTIDPDSVELHFSNGRVMKPINTRSVYGTATEDRDKWLAKAGKRAVQAGQKLVDAIVFVPDRTDLRELAEVTINIDGAPIVIPGHYYTVQEKAELMERARRAQSPAGR